MPDTSFDGDATLFKVPVEPEMALAMLLRRNRQDRKLTQKEVARLLGMKILYSYQRLERKSNSSLAIIKKIHTVFPDIQLGNLL